MSKFKSTKEERLYHQLLAQIAGGLLANPATGGDLKEMAARLGTEKAIEQLGEIAVRYAIAVVVASRKLTSEVTDGTGDGW